jgi:hypothetical protein
MSMVDGTIVKPGPAERCADTCCRSTPSALSLTSERAALIRQAFRLEWMTVAWMVVEGVVALGAGLAAGSLTLMAFGLDSAIELASAGVLMWRLNVELRAVRYIDRGSAEQRGSQEQWTRKRRYCHRYSSRSQSVRKYIENLLLETARFGNTWVTDLSRTNTRDPMAPKRRDNAGFACRALYPQAPQEKGKRAWAQRQCVNRRPIGPPIGIQ